MQTCYFGNFGNAWPSPSKMIVSICRKFPCSYRCNKSTSSLTFFLRYCKEIENLLFWVIWACLATPKMIVSIWRNLWCLSARKKTKKLHSFHFPWDIAKILQNCYSGYFEQACLHKPKIMLAPCRKLSYLFTGKRATTSPCFSRNIAKICKLTILSTLGMPGCAHPK